MNVLNQPLEFMPEIYYSFIVSNQYYDTNISNKTLLLCSNIISSMDIKKFNCIIGINDKKKIQLKSEFINQHHFDYLSNIEILGSCYFDYVYLHECWIENMKIIEDSILNGFNSHLVLMNCKFKNQIQINNLSNLLLYECSMPILQNLNIVNIVHINGSHFFDKYYIYNKQSASINISLQQYKFLKPNILYKPILIRKKNKYYMKFNVDNKFYYKFIDYCISPGVNKPKHRGINLYEFLKNGNTKELIVIPNGIYYLEKSVPIQSHLIGIGFPIIHFCYNAQFILQQPSIMIEGIKIKNYSNQAIFVINSQNTTLMNIYIENQIKSKEGNSFIIINSNYNYLNNLWLFNLHQCYDYGILIMGNYNVFISVYLDAFKSANIYNMGEHNELIYINHDIISNYAIMSLKKIQMIGNSFFSYSVYNETYNITHDSIIKNSYIIYLDDYNSIYASKLLYFPYFINYDKIKKEEYKIKKIIYIHKQQCFLLSNY